MSDLQARVARRAKKKVGPADWGFVAFVIIITAIAVMLTLGKIYFQNPV
jgi:hypothetical protein